MPSIAAPLLLVGCVEYAIEDPDASVSIAGEVEERFVQAPLPALDVLFVVDGTGSMAEEQASFAAAAAAFVGVLDDLRIAYQLGVTTTAPAGDGALVGRPWIVTRDADDPAGALAAALQVGTTSVEASAGLWAALRAVDDTQPANRGFRRADAGLHVVFVSDDDDESDGLLAGDPAVVFTEALATIGAVYGLPARASAVVGDVPDGCDGPTGSARAGTRYAAVAQASGGLTTSICASDFAALATALGDAAVAWPASFALSDVPVAESVRVSVDGARVTEGWTLDVATPAVVFDAPPAPDAVIVVTYAVAEAK